MLKSVWLWKRNPRKTPKAPRGEESSNSNPQHHSQDFFVVGHQEGRVTSLWHLPSTPPLPVKQGSLVACLWAGRRLVHQGGRSAGSFVTENPGRGGGRTGRGDRANLRGVEPHMPFHGYSPGSPPPGGRQLLKGWRWQLHHRPTPLLKPEAAQSPWAPLVLLCKQMDINTLFIILDAAWSKQSLHLILEAGETMR